MDQSTITLKKKEYKNTFSIVVGKTGDPSLLELPTFQRVLAEASLREIQALQDQMEVLTDTLRSQALEKVAETYGLSPPQIDLALRQWAKQTNEPEDISTAAEFLKLFPTPIASIPQFDLLVTANTLQLGQSAELEVVSALPEQVDNFKCSWTIEPGGLLLTEGDLQSDCNITARMAPNPNKKFADIVNAQISARVYANDRFLAEQRRKMTLVNGIAHTTVLSPPQLSPDSPVTVSINSVGSDQPLQLPLRCSWTANHQKPLLIKSKSLNNCRVQISIKPLQAWTFMEAANWNTGGEVSFTATWDVQIVKGSTTLPGPLITIQVPVNDNRPAEVFNQYVAQLQSTQLEDVLRTRYKSNLQRYIRAGLPSPEEFDETGLSLEIQIDEHKWRPLTKYKVPGSSQSVILDTSELLTVSYSEDGLNFSRNGLNSFDFDKLQGVISYWVKIDFVGLLDRELEFEISADGRDLFLTAIMKRWRTLPDESKSLIACQSFVGNERSHYNAEMYLPLIDSIAIRRRDGAIWREKGYGGTLDRTDFRTMDRLSTPPGEADYIIRLGLLGGELENYSCTTQKTPRLIGRQYQFDRLSKANPLNMDSIEIFIGKDFHSWIIEYYGSIHPDFVRISDDGTNFQTIRTHASFDEKIELQTLKINDKMHLRFVLGDGQEVEYQGPFDTKRHLQNLILEEFGKRLRLACSNWESDSIGCLALVDNAPSGYDLTEGLGDVLVGCEMDDLKYRHTPNRENSALVYAPFLCDTLYSQFVFQDGRSTIVVGTPVETMR